MSEATTLVALTPAEMPAAQTALVDWCLRRMREVAAITRDLAKNLEIAKRNRWGSRVSLQTTLARERKRIDFYRKIKAAVQEGYLIIPNFPVDAFAVRVTSNAPPRIADTYVSDNIIETRAQLAGPGEGRYVDDTQLYHDYRRQITKADGTKETTGQVFATKYDEVIDLPMTVIKPIVLEATERAMALKIFDTLGIVRQRKRDPIIVGTIIDPRERYPRSDHAKRVTFFIAWWLDLETL